MSKKQIKLKKKRDFLYTFKGVSSNNKVKRFKISVSNFNLHMIFKSFNKFYRIWYQKVEAIHIPGINTENTPHVSFKLALLLPSPY